MGNGGRGGEWPKSAGPQGEAEKVLPEMARVPQQGRVFAQGKNPDPRLPLWARLRSWAAQGI